MNALLSDADSWWYCDHPAALPRAFNESFESALGSSTRDTRRINVIEFLSAGGDRLLITSGLASIEVPDLIIRARKRQANSTIAKILAAACSILSARRDSSCTETFKVGAKNYRLNPVSLNKNDLGPANGEFNESAVIFLSMVCAERTPILMEVLPVNSAGEFESALDSSSSSIPPSLANGSAHAAFARATKQWSHEIEEFKALRYGILDLVGDAASDLGAYLNDNDENEEDETAIARENLALARRQEEINLDLYDKIESVNDGSATYTSVFDIDGFGPVTCHAFQLDLTDLGIYSEEREEETTLLNKLVFSMEDGTRIGELRCRVMSFMDEEECEEVNPFAYSLSDRDWLSAIFNPDCTLRKETLQAWEQMPDLFCLLDRIWIAPVFRTVENLAQIVTIGAGYSSYHHPFLPQDEVRVGVCIRFLEEGEDDSPSTLAWYNKAAIEQLVSVKCRPVAHMFPFNTKSCSDEHPRVYALAVLQGDGG